MRGCAAGQGIVFLPLCPEQGIKFRTRLSLIGNIISCKSDLIINRVIACKIYLIWLINFFLYFQATKVINIMRICLHAIGNKLL